MPTPTDPDQASQRAPGSIVVADATRGLETVVTIAIAPREGGTEVTLHHATLRDDEIGRGH
jgi:hypothetical protein